MNNIVPAQTLPSTIGSLLSLIWRQTDRLLRMRVFGTLLLTLAVASLNATSPLLYKKLVDWFAKGEAARSLGFPLKLVAAYLLIVAISRTCAELRWIVYGGFEQRVQHRLLLLLFDHVHSLSLRYHLERKTGGLQQVLFNALLGYRFILFNSLMVILPLLLYVILVSSVLAISYPIAFVLIMLLMCTLYILSLFLGVERQRLLQRSANSAFEDASARTADSYLNFETIKLFGCERIIRGGLDEAVGRGQRNFVQFYLLRTLTGFAQSFWLMLWLAATVTLAALYVRQGVMTVGDFVLVNAYTLQLWIPLDFLGLSYREIRMGQTNLERMFSLLGERTEIADRADAFEFPIGRADLGFENVAFFYDPKRPILRGVSFSVPQGRMVAIVGPSGAGKSTIARLTFRFYDVCSGRITVNGAPIEAFTLKSLRAAIAVVPQDTVLFNDTIAHNIGIARDGCSPSDIEDAARTAEIHDFIVSLPDGYRTIVGERGLKLSGGQKQRVAIARAVLKRASLLIFDEATSALDSETEHAIQRNLRTAFGGITTLIITHRLSTIIHADEIVVLNEGRVVERGRHGDLLSAAGL
jgi:ABC-type transport system involved in Fe-S cluster assembly fused permease/ATPase subunit